MAIPLYSAFTDAVNVFNNTFYHLAPYTPAEKDNVGQYYHKDIDVHSPGQHKRNKTETLDDFANTAPLHFDRFIDLHFDQNARTVTGSGYFTDHDGGKMRSVPISFKFDYILDPTGPGGWLIVHAFSKLI
jgi:hypothetical protein